MGLLRLGEGFGDGGEGFDESGNHTRVNGFRSAVGRVVEERVVSDDGHLAASTAVDNAGFPAWDGATRNSTVDCESGRAHPIGKRRFHFVVGRLDVVAWLLGGTDICTEVYPRPALFRFGCRSA